MSVLQAATYEVTYGLILNSYRAVIIESFKNDLYVTEFCNYIHS